MRTVIYLLIALVILCGPACTFTIGCPGGPQGQTGGFGQGQQAGKPAAFIDLITPSSAAWGDSISFSGHGVIAAGTIVAHRWRSSIDGELSDQAVFSTSSLSPGKHIILFSVKDGAGNWSLETQGTVNLKTETAEGPPDADDEDGGGTPPAATPPAISTFSASPVSITVGMNSTLSWNVTNATTVTIDHGVGSVALSGSRVVSPTSTTTYTLTASNPAYYSQATTKVTVGTITLVRPDLIIEDIWSSSGKIYYRIKNQGTGASGATTARLTVDGVVKSTDPVGSLAAGAVSTQNFSGYAWSCSGTSDSIKVEADYNTDVTELNEGNNSLTKNFTCYILAPAVIGTVVQLMKPDLVITSIAKSGNKVKFTVKNQGTADSGGFTVKLYVNGAYKDSVTISGGLVAGGQASFTFPSYTHVCVLWLSYTIGVTADTGGTVNESNETNNSAKASWACTP